MLFTTALFAALSASVLATPLEPRKSTALKIHPNGDQKWCLVPAGGGLHNNVAVILQECDFFTVKDIRWNINKGSGSITVVNSVFALDGTEAPANGTLAKIYKSYPGIPAQTWYYTNDNRIALQGQGFCVDLQNGKKSPGNTIQYWKCTTGNTNQIWTTSS